MRRFRFLFVLLLVLGCGPGYQLRVYHNVQEYLRATQKLYREFSQDDTVLAQYQGGNITRRNMVEYVVANYGLEGMVGSINRPKCVFTSYARQKTIIDEMIEKKILLEEARRTRFDQRKEIRALVRYADQRLLIPIHFRKVIAPARRVQEPACKVRHIFLRFPRSMPEYRPDQGTALPEENRPVLEKARRLRTAALGGKNFTTLARKHSQDYTAKQGGMLGWITAASMGRSYWQAVNNLPPQGISRPVITDQGIYVVQLLERTVLSDQDYKQKLHPRFVYKLEERLRKQAEQGVLARLYRDPAVNINWGLLNGGKPEAVLARVGDYRITVRQFEDEFRKFAKGYKIGTFSAAKLRDWKERFLKKYLITPRLLVRDALRLGLDKSEAYKKARKNNRKVRERILFLEMRDHLFREGPGDIPRERIRAIFNKYKWERYYTLVPLAKQERGKYPDERVVEKDGKLQLKQAPEFDKLPTKMLQRVVADMRHAWLDRFLRRRKQKINFRLADKGRFIVLFYAGPPPGRRK